MEKSEHDQGLGRMARASSVIKSSSWNVQEVCSLQGD
jgi:hypothetical protein